MIEQDMFEYEQQDENKVYGLGVPKQQTIQCDEDPTPTSTPNNTGQNAIPTFRSPMIISQEALNAVAFGVMEGRPEWTMPTKMEAKSTNIHFNGEHFCAPVIHPTTEN